MDVVRARRRVERLREESQRHQGGDQQQDHRRLLLLRQVEGEAVRAHQPPADGRPGQHREEGNRQDVQVGREYPHPGIGQQRGGKLPPYGVAEYEEQVAGGEGEEAPEDEEVGQARPVSSKGDLLQHLPLAQDQRNGPLQAAEGLVEPAGRLAQEDEPEDPEVEQHRREGEDRHRQRVYAHPRRNGPEYIVRWNQPIPLWGAAGG